MKFSKIFFFMAVFSVYLGQAQTYTGYTLYGKMGNNKVYLLNMDKTIYHTWTCSPNTGYSTYLLPNKHIMRTATYSGNVLSGPAMCGMVQDVDWDGNVSWQYVYSTSTYCTHHDICPMPNGHVLLIAYEVKSPAEVSAAGCSQSITMWPDKIVEIAPSGTSGGTVVWEWHIWDHLCQNLYPAKSNYVTSIAQHPELLNINYNTQQDWMHTNGIDYNSELDQVIISSHNMNEVYVIDHSTTTAQAATHSGGNSGKGGDILYRWGNPLAYGCGTSSNQVFKVVHDAHWVPYGCPHAADIVGFNNQGATGNHSCVDRITPPYNGYTYVTNPGSAFTPSTYTARHTCLGDAGDQSNSQQLPNGNTLVCIASTGYIYEIDANQTLLWSYTAGGTVAQAFRYTDCYLNGNLTVTASSAAAGVCSGSPVQLVSSANVTSGTTYSWYSVPSGFTSTLQSPVVTPTTTTRYYVTATNSTCTSIDSVTITVSGPLSVTATAVGGTICAGSSTQLGVNVSGGSTYYYSWTSSPAGFTSSLQSPVVSPSVTTTYTVNVCSGYCTSGSSITVNVSAPITVAASAAPSTINMGETSQLNAVPSGGTSNTYSWVSNPAGFTSTLQNPVVSPAVTTIYTVTAVNGACTASNPVTVTQTGISEKVLNLTLFLEALFNGSTMNKAQDASGDHFPGSQADAVTVELHSASAPYALVSGPYTTALSTSGLATTTLTASLSGSYYIVVKHRNSIETWSAAPVSFAATTINYNFSDASSRAYGGNLKQQSGKYLFYSGDVNQDGIVDSGDMIPLDNDAAGFTTGYISSDANGDGLVDSGDMILVDNNSALFITKSSPE